MSVTARRAPDDVRHRILAAAWEVAGQLGVHATIADVAGRLGMSSGNVYRFFPSKQALSDAVCSNQLSKLTDAVRVAAEGSSQPIERVRAALLAMHTGMREQMLNQARVQEIVDAAFRQHWPAIHGFRERGVDMIARLVAEGQARGDFVSGDPRWLADQLLLACASIHHPTLIAHGALRDPPVRAEDVVDFALSALTLRSEKQSASAGGA